MRQQRWNVRIFQRKLNPDLSSPLVRSGNGMVPRDMIPTELEPIVARGTVDEVRKSIRKILGTQGRVVMGINVNAERKHELVVYVQEKRQSNAR